MHDRLTKAHTIIDEAIERHSPVALFAAFSGGHDSLTSTSIAMKHPLVEAVVHINTGIGIEQTRDFVRSTCTEQNWPLIELHPPDGHSYEDIVLEKGFPGPAGHLYVYTRLKERALRVLSRRYKTKKGDRIAVITGVRTEESTRRMGHVDPIAVDGDRVWIAPIHDWSKIDCNRHISELGLPRNEVVDKIHMSGECLCGAFAKPNEIAELEFWFPEVAGYLHRLEHEVRDRGLPCIWGARPPKGGTAQMPLVGLCTKCEAG